MSPSLVWLPITVSFFVLNAFLTKTYLGINFSSSLALQYSDGETRCQYQKPTRLCWMHICSQGNMVTGGDGKASTKMRPLISIRSFTVQRQDGVRGMFLHYDREMGLLHVRWATQRPDNLPILTTQSPTQTYPLQM